MVDYVGNTAKLLAGTVDEMNQTRESKAHQNHLPIIQSSGTGKSRAVDEVAKQIFTIPIHLGPDQGIASCVP